MDQNRKNANRHLRNAAESKHKNERAKKEGYAKRPVKKASHELHDARVAAAAPEATEPDAAKAVKLIAEKEVAVLESLEGNP